MTLNLQFALLAYIIVPNHTNTGYLTMPYTETIPDVPLDCFGSLTKHPAIAVKLSRDSTKGDSFTGTAPHLHEHVWIQSDVEPLKPIHPLDRDWSRGAESYKVTLPESEVKVPTSATFVYDHKLGWTCELGTFAMEGSVGELVGGNVTRRTKISRPQDFKVRRRLLLPPGIAACLREQRSEPSLRASVRTCRLSVRVASSFTDQRI